MTEKKRCGLLMDLIIKLKKENDTETLEFIKTLVEDNVGLKKMYQIMTESTPISQFMGVETMADLPNTSKQQKLCDFTLKRLVNDFQERLEELKLRKDTPITGGRYNEMQLCIIHLQQLILDNLGK